jgi:pilus assembly protein CpaB
MNIPMNNTRTLMFGVAGVAAFAVALLVRGLVGSGDKPKAPIVPSLPPTRQVLVASSDMQPGTPLTIQGVRWQEWPRSSVDSNFITQDAFPDAAHVVQGTVVRAPLVAGEPLTDAKIVHADTAGFLAALVNKGMRAVSIPISTETDAGGFILPNDRVDVVVTLLVSESPRRFASKILLKDVRVLAVDQTYKYDKDQKTVLAKTATLELTPVQAVKVAAAVSAGTLSLALHALGDASALDADAARKDKSGAHAGATTAMTVVRYGVVRVVGGAEGD